jgi:hypothetical protein
MNNRQDTIDLLRTPVQSTNYVNTLLRTILSMTEYSCDELAKTQRTEDKDLMAVYLGGTIHVIYSSMTRATVEEKVRDE